MQRKAYRIDKTGLMSNLKLVEESISSPTNNEVQVKVHAIGLNFADVFAIHGLYSATPRGSFVPGLEFSGEIIEVGSEVNQFKVGDRVMAVTRFGGYADHINIDDRHIVKLQNGWTYEEGASLLVQGLTAYYALIYLGGMKQNQNVLIHSGAGGVGIMANRIAKHFGAFTIGTVGSQSKVDFLKKEGFDKQIVRGDDFENDLIQSLDGRDLNIVLETIGGGIFEAGYKVMASQGRIVVVGASQFASPGNKPNYIKLLWKFLTRPKIDPQQMIQDNKSVMAFNLIWLYDKVDIMDEMMYEMAKMDLGKPHVGHTFAFDQLHEALTLFQSGHSTGKVVVRVNHS